MTKPGSYRCDVCKRGIIDLEHRFHCADCPGDFDLCPTCFSKKSFGSTSHHASHTIQEFSPSQLIVVDYGEIKENSIRCNSCKKYISKLSKRYHCLDCFDVDMCQDCYKSKNYFKDHKSSHKLELFTYCVGIPLTGFKDDGPSKTESNAEVQKLQHENSKLEQEQSKLQQEISKLKQENSKLQQDLSKANSQNVQATTAAESGIAYFPVSLVTNPLGGFTLTTNAIGTECLFGFDSESKKRTVFIDKKITEGVYHFLIKTSYGKGQPSTAFDIGVAPSDNLKQFNDRTLGELLGSCSLGLGKMGPQSISIMDGVSDKEKTMSMEDTAPDGALVGCEIDSAAHTVSFFIDGKKFPRAVSGIRNPLNFGFDGAGYVTVTPISLRRLPSATSSTVKPVFFACKN